MYLRMREAGIGLGAPGEMDLGNFFIVETKQKIILTVVPGHEPHRLPEEQVLGRRLPRKLHL